jgi:hypothetical protein
MENYAILLEITMEPALVAPACNSSYLGGWDLEVRTQFEASLRKKVL